MTRADEASRAPAREVRWHENRPVRGLAPLDVAEIWAYRDLIWFLAARDFKLRYRQAVFGVAWAAIQPVAGAILFLAVFRHLAHVSSDGLPYLVFAYIGFLGWTCVATSVSAASESLTGDAALVTKVYFPRLAAPVAACLPALVDLGIALAFLVPLMTVERVTPTVTLLAFPLCVLGLLLIALGAGLWLAVLNAQYRDVRYTLGLLLQLWLFASPIGYPTSLVHGWWRWLYAVNPLAGALDALRWSLTGARWPGIEVGVSAGAAIALLSGALLWYQRAERIVADVI